ncbi:MAG TPA: hypothetical protein VGN27_01535 [Gaiellaceae bacterium]|jgi:hypothetical protein|nr:hypothetical protein [Gaiellaceae bacterium]
MASRIRSSNHRASLSTLLGVVAVIAVPAGVEIARVTAGVSLLDAGYAIPVAAIAGLAAILFARGAAARVHWTLERAGGLGRARLGRLLGIAGICFALSGSIAIAFYELLLLREHSVL